MKWNHITAAVLSILLITGGISVFSANADAYALGDVNEDNSVNASDAARVLIASANIGSGQESGLTDSQWNRADYNQDGSVNALDAAGILVFAAEQGAGLTKETEAETQSQQQSGEGIQRVVFDDDDLADDYGNNPIHIADDGITWN